MFFVRFQKAILSLCVLTCTQASASTYLKSFQNTRVPVAMSKHNRVQEAEIINRDGNELNFAIRDQGSEISLGLTVEDLQSYSLAYRPSKQYYQLRARMSSLEPENALEQIKPFAYPLINYLDLPWSSELPNQLVSDLLALLIQLEQFDEAHFVIKKFPLKQLGEDQINQVAAIMAGLFDDGKARKATQLLNHVLSSENKSAEYTNQLIALAHRLRQEGNTKIAYSIYQRLLLWLPEESSLRNEVLLWVVYCGQAEQDTYVAELYYEKLVEPDRQSDVFTLYKLCKGKFHIAAEDYYKAMAEISQAIAYLDFSSEWAPELMYYSGICYERLGEPNVAQTIYRELQIFFPNSSWATQSMTQTTEGTTAAQK